MIVMHIRAHWSEEGGVETVSQHAVNRHKADAYEGTSDSIYEEPLVVWTWPGFLHRLNVVRPSSRYEADLAYTLARTLGS